VASRKVVTVAMVVAEAVEGTTTEVEVATRSEATTTETERKEEDMETAQEEVMMAVGRVP